MAKFCDGMRPLPVNPDGYGFKAVRCSRIPEPESVKLFCSLNMWSWLHTTYAGIIAQCHRSVYTRDLILVKIHICKVWFTTLFMQVYIIFSLFYNHNIVRHRYKAHIPLPWHGLWEETRFDCFWSADRSPSSRGSHIVPARAEGLALLPVNPWTPAVFPLI